MTTSVDIGQKLWNYCNILRDAGLSYDDYLEQLTYLIFLKMMDERSRPPYTLLPDYQPPPIPDGCAWPDLLAREGAELESHYRSTLETLSGQSGTLGVIFRKAQNRIQEPAMLTRLVRELIVSGADQDGKQVYVLAEISITVQEKDRARAIRRAELLVRATGVTTIPVVIGKSDEDADGDSAVAFWQFDPDA